MGPRNLASTKKREEEKNGRPRAHDVLFCFFTVDDVALLLTSALASDGTVLHTSSCIIFHLFLASPKAETMQSEG